MTGLEEVQVLHQRVLCHHFRSGWITQDRSEGVEHLPPLTGILKIVVGIKQGVGHAIGRQDQSVQRGKPVDLDPRVEILCRRTEDLGIEEACLAGVSTTIDVVE